MQLAKNGFDWETRAYYFASKFCSALDVQVSVEPTVGGEGLSLRGFASCLVTRVNN
jgi:hypothetical protein